MSTLAASITTNVAPNARGPQKPLHHAEITEICLVIVVPHIAPYDKNIKSAAFSDLNSYVFKTFVPNVFQNCIVHK